jgi:hypothetical protein
MTRCKKCNEDCFDKLDFEQHSEVCELNGLKKIEELDK